MEAAVASEETVGVLNGVGGDEEVGDNTLSSPSPLAIAAPDGPST